MPWLPDVFRRALAFERDVATTHGSATTFIPIIAVYYTMAILVQLPRTRLYRAALLPVVYWTTLRAGLSPDFSRYGSDYASRNQALALGMLMIALRCTAWTFAPRPYVRLPICRTGNRNVTSHVHRENIPEDAVSVSFAMWSACDLLLNFRLIGWNEPRKRFIATPYPQAESRRMFRLVSLRDVLFLTVALDAVCRMIHWLGSDTFATSNGGTIFDSSVPPLERYMKSSTVSLLFAIASYVYIRATYQFLALLFMTLFQQYPSQWPPLFDSPWLSTSLTSFWGRRWHQLLREALAGVASPLLGSLFGPLGTIFGAFALSGILHELGPWGTGRLGDTMVIIGFFLMHGIGVAIEFVWRRTTGRRVGGVLGWLWTAAWLLFPGQLLVDVCARHGQLAQSGFSIEAYRPTTLILNGIAWKNVSL